MNNENPYRPPSGELLSPEPLFPLNAKRPKSQKWVLVIFGALLAGRIYFASKYPLTGALETALFFWVVVPLIPLIFFRNAKATYYIASASVLGFVATACWDTLLLQLGYWKLGWGMFLPQLFASAVILRLLYKLARHYVFGAVSRAYYGLGPIRSMV
jgi:hypothetical protein